MDPTTDWSLVLTALLDPTEQPVIGWFSNPLFFVSSILPSILQYNAFQPDPDTIIILCDENAYMALYGAFIRCIYPTLSLTGFYRCMMIDYLDRLGTHRPINHHLPPPTLTYVSAVYQRPIVNTLQQFYQHHYQQLPMDHRLVEVTFGVYDPALADVVKQVITHTLNAALEDVYSSHALLYFTQPMIDRMGPPSSPGDELKDIIAPKGLINPLKGSSLQIVLKTTQDKKALVEAIIHDLNLLADVSLAVNIDRFKPTWSLYHLLYCDDPQKLLTDYLKMIATGFSPLDYIAFDKIGITSVNFMAWCQSDEARDNQLIPTWLTNGKHYPSP